MDYIFVKKFCGLGLGFGLDVCSLDYISIQRKSIKIIECRRKFIFGL